MSISSASLSYLPSPCSRGKCLSCSGPNSFFFFPEITESRI
uniref:Uncharacterized protein n=1 Tax=Anguilla anguilla TaxID=7936 RepID=A0A0E9PBY5_ANGAN